MGKSDNYQSWISILSRHQLDLKGTLVGDIFQMVGSDKFTNFDTADELGEMETPVGKVSRIELAIATLIEQKEKSLKEEVSRIKEIEPAEPSEEDLDTYAQDMLPGTVLRDEIVALYRLLWAIIKRRFQDKLNPETTGFAIRKGGIIVMLFGYLQDPDFTYPTFEDMLY